MTIREGIQKIIQKVAHAEEEIKVEHPLDPRLGDYSTNIAFVLAKEAEKNPIDIANELAEKILSDKKAKKMFEKVEAAGAGFINFTLSESFLQKQLSDVRHTISHINVGRGRELNIEFLSANPTGKFQVGNGRIGFYGDALGNILKLAGYKVTKEYYINNAKSSNQIQELGKTALGQGERYLTSYLKDKIAKLTLTRPVLVNFGEAGFLLAQEIQKDNQEFLEKIGIHYDVWTREEEDLVQSGLIKKALVFLKNKGLVYEKDEAQWLKTTKFGDDKDKVIVRSSGDSHSAPPSPNASDGRSEAPRDRHGYYLADIAYHQNKIKRGYKVIIDIFGADHQGHVGPMKVAMKILGYKGKFDILVSQLVQARGGGKFSKRTGNIIELEDLIDEVGLDVARYFYLAKSLDTQMEFDLDLAKEQSDKNPVYYIQYANARMSSILRHAYRQAGKAQNNFQFSIFPPRADPSLAGNFQTISKLSKLLKHESELNLIKHLFRWPEVVEDTAKDYQVQRITTYAYELAVVFNQFYRDCRVISDDRELTNARLGLVSITRKTLMEVLGMLGISVPDRM